MKQKLQNTLSFCLLEGFPHSILQVKSPLGFTLTQALKSSSGGSFWKMEIKLSAAVATRPALVSSISLRSFTFSAVSSSITFTISVLSIHTSMCSKALRCIAQAMLHFYSHRIFRRADLGLELYEVRPVEHPLHHIGGERHGVAAHLRGDGRHSQRPSHAA